ncbi:MAG: CHAP domain-containing protein, partial [Bacteroidaceae bacterium]
TGSHEWHEPDDEENGSEEDGNRPPSGNEGENQTGGNFGGGTGGSPGVPTGREYIAYIASQYIGRNETDDIDLIKSWLRNAGFSQPNNSTPWCAAFAYNMFQEAGYEGYKSASVSQWKEHYGRYVTIPEVGDVAFFPNMSHIGIVVDIAGENITVIHGNWSNKVSKTIHTINYFDAYKRGK